MGFDKECISKVEVLGVDAGKNLIKKVEDRDKQKIKLRRFRI